MSYYKILIAAWPYSTGNGSKVDYERAGPEKREFIVNCRDFDDAVCAANLLVDGIKSSGHVYAAPIRSIVYCGEERLSTPNP